MFIKGTLFATLLILSLCSLSEGTRIVDEPFPIQTTPRLLRVNPQSASNNSGTRPLLSEQKVDRIYPELAEFALSLGHRTLYLSIQKNKYLFADSYLENDINADPPNCYYHGHVKTFERSSKVVVALCYGMEGTININDVFLTIRPLTNYDKELTVLEASTVLHEVNLLNVTYPERDADGNIRSYLFRGEDEHLPSPSEPKKNTSVIPEEIPAKEIPAEEIPAKEPPNEPMPSMKPIPSARRTARIFIYNDKARYERYGSKTEYNTASIINYVSSFFSESALKDQIQVLLAGQITWRGVDPLPALQYPAKTVPPRVNSGLLLDQFIELTQRQMVVSIPHTHRQLFSNRKFAGGIIGLASVGSTCLMNSGSVCEVNRSTEYLNAIASAHELLHELNAQHDGVAGNQCSANGFIMSPYAGYASAFSPCTTNTVQNYLKSSHLTCLAS